MSNAWMGSGAATARGPDAGALDALAHVARGTPEEKRTRIRALSPALIRALRPIVRGSVKREMRRRVGGHRAVEQEVDDIVQTVLLGLFAPEGGALEAWNPDHQRALGLERFVALVAVREVDTILRSRRRNPWTEEPVVAQALDASTVPEDGAEALVGLRRMLLVLVSRLRARVSPLGFTLFEMLLLQERTPVDVAAALGLSVPAVHTWRSRLCRTARQIVTELDRDG